MFRGCGISEELMFSRSMLFPAADEGEACSRCDQAEEDERDVSHGFFNISEQQASVRKSQPQKRRPPRKLFMALRAERPCP